MLLSISYPLPLGNAPLEQLLLFLGDYPLLLRIKLLPLLLEHLPANSFVLLDPIGLEFPTAALPASHKLQRIHIELSNIKLILFVQVSNTLLLELLQLPPPLQNIILSILRLSLTEVAILRNLLMKLLFILTYAPFSSFSLFFWLDFGLDIEAFFEIADLFVVCSSDFHTLLEVLLLSPQPLLMFGGVLML